MMKKFLMPFLMASLMITSALSLNSCKKNDAVAIEGTTSEIQQLPNRIVNTCPICDRILQPTPTSILLPPPLVSTDYSCYHEYAIGESCPYYYCAYPGLHHYHFFFVGYDHNSTGQDHMHIGGGSK